jgi:hypothetical protein
MDIQNETPEEKLLREENEKNAKPVITDELFEEELQKRMGAGSKDLIKKTDVPPVLTEADKIKLAEEKRQKAITTGLEEKWFDTKQYDEFQQLSAKGKIEIARKKFIEENNDLADAEATFNEMFRINEDDDIEVNEAMVPNAKKKVAQSLAEKLADEYMEKNYGSIMKVESKYDEVEQLRSTGRANLAVVTKKIEAIPDELEVPIEGTDLTFKYKVTPEDRQHVQDIFGRDKTLLGHKDINAEPITENGIVAIKAKNLAGMISEAVKVALKTDRDLYERGEKGLDLNRKDSNISKSEMEKFAEEKGLIPKQKTTQT